MKVARQAAIQNNACLGTSEQIFSNDTSLEETFNEMDDTSAFQETEKESVEELMENKENFRWSHMAIMLLLEEYRLRESSMSSGKISHRRAWDEIATTMHTKGYNVTGRQCMTRINTMKRTYKTIKDHNSKSGNNTRTWKYYEVMESLLSEKPYITPLTTISSTGFVTSKKRPTSPSNCSGSSSSSSSNVSTCQSSDKISRKRKSFDMEVLMQQIEEEKKKRHKEKMEIQKKMLERLDKLIDKM